VIVQVVSDRAGVVASHLLVAEYKAHQVASADEQVADT